MTKVTLKDIDSQIITVIGNLIGISDAASKFYNFKVSESLGKEASVNNESEHLINRVEAANSNFTRLSELLANVVAELEDEEEELVIGAEVSDNGLEYKGRYNDDEEDNGI